MSLREPPVVRHNALRMLADEARREAALLEVCDPEHAFFAGVAASAEDRLHPEVADIHGESWLARESPPFRDGYLKAADVIAHAGPDLVRLIVPTYDPGLSRDR